MMEIFIVGDQKGNEPCQQAKCAANHQQKSVHQVLSLLVQYLIPVMLFFALSPGTSFWKARAPSPLSDKGQDMLSKAISTFPKEKTARTKSPEKVPMLKCNLTHILAQTQLWG
jgi:hypothetical protein